MMPRWLPRPALARTRIAAGDGERVIVADEPDPTVDALVARSAAALGSIAGWAEDQIDALIGALAAQIAAHAEELAAATVAETGLGCVPDKAVKNRFASLGVAQSLTSKPGVGVAGGSGPEGLTEIAEPMGVIVGLIPVTNPVATLVFKALICIKARDALIASCHRDAIGVAARTTGLLRQVLARHGACADLVQNVPRRPGRQATAALMRHPGVAMILATGGTAMVTAAYSSGTPAIGVGPGNAPAWVCADADVVKAARMVVASKAFDHGIICGSENNLIIDQSVRGDFTAALRAAGAAVLGPADCDRLARAAFDGRDGRLRRAVLGQAPTAIAAQAGHHRPGRHPPARRARAPPGRAGPLRPGKARPDPVAVHRRRPRRRRRVVSADPRQRRPRPHRDHPHPQPATPTVLRPADARQPDPGQRARRARLHRPGHRADPLPHPRLRHRRPHLDHRQHHLHPPGQHQTGRAPAHRRRRPVPARPGQPVPDASTRPGGCASRPVRLAPARGRGGAYPAPCAAARPRSTPALAEARITRLRSKPAQEGPDR
jgi:acyl-CoA reductase-like NAD-dependent aldehyde dehydrogenase